MFHAFFASIHIHEAKLLQPIMSHKNSARDCYVMNNEACSWPTFHCITYCLMDNYHTPRPTAAFISFRTANALDALVTREQVRFK